MVAFPFCKINIGLNVISKRSDGYHDLETCFYPVPWTDVLELIPAVTLSFTSTGLSIPGKPEDNLCLKAYYLLQDRFDLPPVAFHLHKIVPLGAGLGGGSSDAVFSLRLLNDMFDLNLDVTQLAAFALQLGSDCPYFVYQDAMLGRGRGDELTPVTLSLKGYHLVVVKPAIHVSTANAFRGIKPARPSYDLSKVLAQPISTWRDTVENDFETPIFQAHPSIRKIKEALYGAGAVYASMSGSGAAVYGIFNEAIDLSSSFEGCTYWSGVL